MLDWHSVCFCSAKRAFLNVKSLYTTGNLKEELILSAELMMYTGHCKEFQKPTFREKSANDLVILRKTQHHSFFRNTPLLGNVFGCYLTSLYAFCLVSRTRSFYNLSLFRPCALCFWGGGARSRITRRQGEQTRASKLSLSSACLSKQGTIIYRPGTGRFWLSPSPPPSLAVKWQSIFYGPHWILS